MTGEYFEFDTLVGFFALTDIYPSLALLPAASAFTLGLFTGNAGDTVLVTQTPIVEERTSDSSVPLPAPLFLMLAGLMMIIGQRSLRLANS